VVQSVAMLDYRAALLCIIEQRRGRPFARMKCHALCESRDIVTRLRPSPALKL